MSRVKSFIILASASLVVGCATQGQSTSAGAAASHETSAAARSAVAPTASAAPQSASAASATDEAATRGYERVVLHGQEMYCQHEPITGSHIMQRLCLTKDELLTQQKNTQQLMQDLERETSNGKPQECRTMGSTAPC